MIVALFDFAAAHHELHHLLFHEAGFSEEDAFTSVRSQLTDLIAEGVETGELHVRTCRPRRFPSSMACTAHSWTACTPSRPGHRRAANEVADLVDRALRRAEFPGQNKVSSRLDPLDVG